MDLNAFKADVDALGARMVAERADPAHLAHLHRIITITNVLYALGVATMWLPAYTVLPWLCISTATFARWSMVAHHVMHGGYDRYSRHTFARGARRFWDWFDWIQPEAWNHEHNKMHHCALGEWPGDPDVVEEVFGLVRRARVPRVAKYAVFALAACTWKWVYYAPGTLMYRRGVTPVTWLPRIVGVVLAPRVALELVLAMVPYILYCFVLLPSACWLVMGEWRTALLNALIAEIVTNVHSFVTIATNHTGSDVHRFDGACSARGEFELRQILGSVDVTTNSCLGDFAWGYLNYQVEHHLWPNLSMLGCRRAHPALVAICARHGIPMVREEGAWAGMVSRVRKTAEVAVGAASMRRFVLADWDGSDPKKTWMQGRCE
jgi:fatty acid desaturase